MWRTVLVVAALGSPAFADDDDPYAEHTMHRAYIGGAGMLVLFPGGDEDSFGSKRLQIGGGGGLNAGLIQPIGESGSLHADAYVLPFGGIYMGRLTGIVGYNTHATYKEGCDAPQGYSCTETYGNRKIRSIVGFVFGGNFMHTPDADLGAIEVGFGYRAQFLVEATFQYDVINGAPGGVVDFAYQWRAIRFGMYMALLAVDGQPALNFGGNVGVSKGGW